MIKHQDLSDTALELLRKTNVGDEAPSDMIDYLYNADFDRKDIEEFVCTNYPNSKNYLIKYLKNLHKYKSL